MRRWTISVEGSFTSEDNDILVATFVRIEVQGDLWILLDMGYFVGVWFAKDQKGIVLPNKPNRAWLGNQV